MKAFRMILIFLLAFFSLAFLSGVKASSDLPVNLYFFYEETCIHCQEENTYLMTLEAEYQNITINRYEVSDSEYNEMLFDNVRDTFGKKQSLTPFLVIGGVALSGFSDQTEVDITNLIDKFSTSDDYTDVVLKIINGENVLASDIDYIRFVEGDYVILPLIGAVPVDTVSLFLASVVIGLVDGFNPCAMWILLFLITLLIEVPNKKRRWILGIAFLFTSGLFYFLIMTSWLEIGLTLTTIRWVRYAIAAIAFVFGAYNIYRFVSSCVKKETGCDVTNIGMKRKFQEMVRNSVSKRNLFLAILGIMLVAVSVNLLELACSMGLPLLFTQILAYRNLSYSVYLFYIMIYVFFFLIDDIVVFVVSMATLQVKAISNRFGKISELIGGVIMLVIGILLMFFPGIIMLS